MKESDVKVERLLERRLAESAVLSVVAQQCRSFLESENNRGRPFAHGDQQRILFGAHLRLDLLHRSAPVCPRRRHLGVACFRENVRSIEEHPCVDVPGNAVGDAVNDVGAPDAREEIRARDIRGFRHAGVERLERIECDELGNPGVAEHGDVGRGVADERGESFSCAADHGICCTSTLIPGCCRSNSGMSCDTTSPSRPIAQRRRVGSRADAREQALAATRNTARRTTAASTHLPLSAQATHQ